MMVPGNRLISWTALAGAGGAALWAVQPGLLPVAAVLCGLLALAAAADAWRGRRAVATVAVTVPGDARATVDRPAALELTVQAGVDLVRIAALWPGAATPEQEILSVHPPADGSAGRVQWPYTMHRRGVSSLTLLRVEVDSPWGLWAFRRDISVTCRMRGYPNMIPEQKGLAAIFLNRGLVGVHAQRQVGKGREVEKLREYLPGDSYEDIHWKTTAKRARPITKVFQVERVQEVYLVMDVSRLSARPAPALNDLEEADADRTQLERFITAAMVLGAVAQRQGDLFGVMAFDEQVRAFVRAGHGRQHYSACRDAVFALEPGTGNPDFGEAFTFLRLRLRRRAMLFFLTSLDDPVLAEGFLSNIGIIARRHLVMVNMLPAPGVGPIFQGADVESPDDVYLRLAGHLVWNDLRELELRLRQRGVSMTMTANERLCPQLVSQYISARQRQLL
jgi:uncharacterized protein (DUF58 family)